MGRIYRGGGGFGVCSCASSPLRRRLLSRALRGQSGNHPLQHPRIRLKELFFPGSNALTAATSHQVLISVLQTPQKPRRSRVERHHDRLEVIRKQISSHMHSRMVSTFVLCCYVKNFARRCCYLVSLPRIYQTVQFLAISTPRPPLIEH